MKSKYEYNPSLFSHPDREKAIGYQWRVKGLMHYFLPVRISQVYHLCTGLYWHKLLFSIFKKQPKVHLYCCKVV